MTSSKEAFCQRVVREHGGDMLDARSLGELSGFCVQDEMCVPNKELPAVDTGRNLDFGGFVVR